MIQELDRVVLTHSLPEYRLEAGDIGTVVLIHQGGKGFEVEFVTLAGQTIAVVSVAAQQIRSIVEQEIAHVRKITL